MDYREKCRIKVLKPAGTQYAKVVVPYMINTSHGSNLGGLRFSMYANQLTAGGSSEVGYDGGSMTSEAMFEPTLPARIRHMMLDENSNSMISRVV